MINIFHRYFRSRWERYYLKNQWHIALDLSLVMLILILLASLFYLYYYRPELPGTGSFSRTPINLDNPPLEVNFNAASPILRDDEPVVLNVALKNGGTEAISGIRLSIETVTSGYSVTQLISDKGSDAATKDASITIDRINAGEEKRIDISATIDRRQDANRSLEWQARLDYRLNNQPFSGTVRLPKLAAAADLSASAFAYYTSPQGDQLGIGPVPPVVGLPTDYWIFWEVSGTGDFRDLTLSARLPQGVELTGDRSLLAGALNYNRDTRQLIWQIPSLSPTDGLSRVSFEVELVPVASQAGQTPVLIEAGRFFGTDVFTGEEVAGSLPALTTALEKDRFNYGQGEVLPQ